MRTDLNTLLKAYRPVLISGLVVGEYVFALATLVLLWQTNFAWTQANASHAATVLWMGVNLAAVFWVGSSSSSFEEVDFTSLALLVASGQWFKEFFVFTSGRQGSSMSSLIMNRALIDFFSVYMPLEEPHFYAFSRLVTLIPSALCTQHLMADRAPSVLSLAGLRQVATITAWFVFIDSCFYLFIARLQSKFIKFTARELKVPLPRPLQRLVDAWLWVCTFHVRLLPDRAVSPLRYSDLVTAATTASAYTIFHIHILGVPWPKAIGLMIASVFYSMIQAHKVLASTDYLNETVAQERAEALAHFARRALAPDAKKSQLAKALKALLLSAGPGSSVKRAYLLLENNTSASAGMRRQTSSQPGAASVQPPQPRREVLWIMNEIQSAQARLTGLGSFLSTPDDKKPPSESPKSAHTPHANGEPFPPRNPLLRWYYKRSGTSPHSIGGSKARAAGSQPVARPPILSERRLEIALGLREPRNALEKATLLPDQAATGSDAETISESCDDVSLDNLVSGVVLDSAITELGLDTYSDWKLARQVGAERCIVVPIVTAEERLGTLHLHLDDASEPVEHGILIQACEHLVIALERIKSKAVTMLLDDMIPGGFADKLMKRTMRRGSIELGSGRKAFGRSEDLSGASSQTRTQQQQRALNREESTSSPDDPTAELMQKFSHCTIVVCDVVGYTRACSDTDPLECLRTLHELYTQFDVLCSNFGVTKLDTIGDSFRAAANLFHPDPDHARTALRFAVELHRCTAGRMLGTHPLNIRIGVATGPIYGSVVGKIRKKFIALGNAIDVATRLEQTGRPGYLHVARSTYEEARLRTNAPGVQERLIRMHIPKSLSFRLRRGTNQQRAHEYVISHTIPATHVALDEVLRFGADFQSREPKTKTNESVTSPRPSFRTNSNASGRRDSKNRASVEGVSPRVGSAGGSMRTRHANVSQDVRERHEGVNLPDPIYEGYEQVIEAEHEHGRPGRRSSAKNLSLQAFGGAKLLSGSAKIVDDRMLTPVYSNSGGNSSLEISPGNGALDAATGKLSYKVE